MRRIALAGLLALAPALSLSACSAERPVAAPASTASTASGVTPAPATAGLIPDDFPLSAEMSNGPRDDVRITAQSVGMRALDFCGRKPLRGLTVTDRLTAEASGVEYAHTRDLMLFADSEPPAAVLADIRAAARACPSDPTGPGSHLLTEVTDSPLGRSATTVLHTFEQDGEVGIGAEIIVVVVVGDALLVTSTYAEWDPATNLDQGVADETAALEATVAAMSLFRTGSAAPGVAS